MIICSSSNIDLIQGVSGYGTVSDGATDWRIENTATGVFNILNSPNLLTPNVSIIDAGNIGIGTIPVSGTNKLQVQGNLNVSGGYFVAGVAFKPATAVLADTATALATSRNIAGVGFTGAAAIDIPYFNLTNKITAGNGISLTAGSASSSPSISTNLTAGNGISISAAASPVISANISAGSGIVFTPTGNNISISSGASSQWTGNVGANIYYNSGNVGIGTATVSTILDIYKSSYTGPLLCLDTGAVSAGAGVMPQAIGKPLLRLGKIGYSQTTGDYYGIGFGYAPLITDFNCAEIGTLITSTAGNETGDLVFSTRPNGTNVAATERMRITSTGNVGIGTNNPGYRLEVSGTTNAGSFNAYHFNNSSAVSLYSGPWADVVSKFNGSIWSTSAILSSSDIRIKEDIQDIIDDTALQSILSIEPKTYKYIDKLVRGDNKVYGFIAQQIREVIPEAITIENSYIPNIYLVADYIDYVITLSSQPTKVIIKMNDKIKCYDKDNKEILVEVIEVIDDLTFRIKEIEYTDTKIFVYGTFVDDFNSLNKDYIFTLNVCATQELHRRIEAQSVLLKSQDDRIKGLESKVATLMSM